jgi:glycerophosphoryl diester phosphodiesterase
MAHLPLIVAHRGASARAPENTISAFRLAAESGAEGIELDVRLARDGVPVVIHDKDLSRTTGRIEKVADLDSTELAELDAVSWFNSRGKRTSVLHSDQVEGVPTLAATLESLKDYRGVIYVELKCIDSNLEPLARAVCRTLLNSSLAPQVIVKSFKLSAIPLVKYFAPELRTAALFAPRIRTILRKEKHLVTIATELGVDEISIHKSLATRKLMKNAHRRQLPVTVWTVDNPRWVKRALALGYKAIITNDPATLLQRRVELAGN